MKPRTRKESIIELTVFLIATGVSSLNFIIPTHSLNPKVHLQYLITGIREDIQRNSKEYSELYKQVLNLGDKDKTDYLNFVEQVDVWRRMGYKGPFIETQGAKQFPEPKLKDLEKAFESYVR